MGLRTDSPTSVPSASLHTILLATDNVAEANDVRAYLIDAGYTVIVAAFDGQSLKGVPRQIPSAVLCHFTDYIERLPQICRTLRSRFENRQVPIIAALSRPGGIDRAIFDSVIFPPAHPSQIANRVNSMVRLQWMEQEITLRAETLAVDFGIHHALNEDSLRKPYRILFIGKATPEFMVIINALQRRNVEVVAAFTSFSAFDYLHESTFDAVVMNALENSEPAFTISQTMRRNSRLFHVPTLFLAQEGTFNAHNLENTKGTGDILSAEASEQEIAGRVLELANYHRIHNQLKQEFTTIGGEACLDEPSGVFNTAFLKSHLKRQCEYHKSHCLPLSLLAVRVRPFSHFEIDPMRLKSALAKFGGMLKNLVRMHDVVARLEQDTFVIAFPGLPEHMTQIVLQRISSLMESAAFESGNRDNGPITFNLQSASGQLLPHETSDMLITNVLVSLSAHPQTLDRAG